MNYFTFYDIPPSFTPDQARVKQQYYALSKKYHPDFYINESAEKQQEVLELSTLNNKAYNVLKDPKKTLQYVLELNGMLPEGENYTLPQDFLMEMMDVNEAIMELELEPDPVSLVNLTNNINAFEAKLVNELKLLTSDFEGLDQAIQQDRLAQIKDIYYRSK
ncbi:MAG: Fe-S protein assembly co-chaperone HscB, partial [Pedobacter sp.]